MSNYSTLSINTDTNLRAECAIILNEVAARCSESVKSQLTDYLYIFKSNSFSEHWHVNKFIGGNNLWGKFNLLHSLNTHASGYQVDGIWPMYFAIICRALDISNSGGSPLLKSESPEDEDDIFIF